MSYVPSNLLRLFAIDELHFPYEMKTNAQLIEFSNLLLRPRPSQAVEALMMVDIVQSVLTLALCARVVIQKRRIQDLRIFTMRESPYGTFIVPNAVWVLLIGVCTYLLGWASFCSYIVFVQKTNRPLKEYLWFIPFPWLPLALPAFYSAYGFVITCSPRSPISNLRAHVAKHGGLSWIHLPIPHSALVMNTLMISVGVLTIGWNVAVTSMSGQVRMRSHQPDRDAYGQLLRPEHTQAFLDADPTDEMLALVKRAWYDQIDIFRYTCLGLGSFMVVVFMTILMLAVWSIPNQLFLIDNLCRIFPGAVPARKDHASTWDNVVMLWHIGWPKNLKGTRYAAFKRAWMTTMIGHTQSLLLMGGAMSFVIPLFYLFFVPWRVTLQGGTPAGQIVFILAYVICVAFLLAGWITGLSATMTFDEIFRAVSGLGSEQSPLASGQTGSWSHMHIASLPRLSRSIQRKFTGANILTSPRVSVFGAFRSPSSASAKSPGLMQPSPCHSPSFLSEKTDAHSNDDVYEPSDNRLYIVHETTVRVEVDGRDLEANPDSLHSIPVYPHPYSPNRVLTFATP